MLTDSMVAERIMLEGMKQDIVILPIHDSFLIRAGFGFDLRHLMENAFEELLEVSTKTSTTPHRFQNTFGWSEKEVINASKDPSKGVINAAALRESYFKDAHNRGLMSGYVSSYIYHKEMMS